MLGAFNLLPLLKGWTYKTHVAERSAVVRGVDPIEILRISETGWLFQITELTDDAYGTLEVGYQSAELELGTFGVNPQSGKTLGAWMQDPSGWNQKYLRPNPASTAGLYFTTFTCGFHGFMFPYVPTVIVKLSLPEESTQESAYIHGAVSVVAITDKKAFVRSLRRVLDAKASLRIDPALLVTGPAIFEKLKEEK